MVLNPTVTGAACEIAPQKSLTVATQPKKLLDVVDRRLLDIVRTEMMGGILQHHPEIFEVEGIARRSTTQTLLAMPTKTRLRMPRARNTLSILVVKKPL